MINKKTMDINEIKRKYPDEWILLGNPIRDESGLEILSGVLLYHSPDKREVCYLGKPLITDYEKTALFFNRVTSRKRNRILLGPFRRIETTKSPN
ncbi:MAG: hypothetical protein LBG31_06735 [Prevotellaceae bacterium]|jgi:hypothetical protein|nr:hypothetical protein [Prevotellaceae bacterium]